MFGIELSFYVSYMLYETKNLKKLIEVNLILKKRHFEEIFNAYFTVF